jgi:hypothetical protein
MNRLVAIVIGLLALGFCPSMAAAEGAYVACDNGLRCVVAPCPSTTARDLATGRAIKGVYPDIDGLPEADRQRLRDADALYFGTLVLRGHIEDRETVIRSRTHRLPTLVVTGLDRAATAAERRHCPRR